MTAAGIKQSHKHDKQNFTQGNNSKLNFCYSTLCQYTEPWLSHRRRKGPADCAERLNNSSTSISNTIRLVRSVGRPNDGLSANKHRV